MLSSPFRRTSIGWLSRTIALRVRSELCWASAVWWKRYYIFFGLALCSSLFALFMKMRLLLYKLQRRRAPMATFLSNAELEERYDIHRQHMTKALLYILSACSEVRHA
jgi:hypothetical protein